MKNNLKYIIGCLVIFVVLVFSSNYNIYGINTQAGEVLIMDGYTISQNTTLKTIESYFGQPQIITDNAFGGKSYTFYDDTMLWLLHVEMDKQDAIKGIGCISDNFETSRYKSGEEDNGSYSYMGGACLTSSDTEKIIGFYAPVNVTRAERAAYYETLLADEANYTFQLQAPTVATCKVLRKRLNKTMDQEAMPRELYDYIEKLHDNGVNVQEYTTAASKGSAIRLTSAGTYEFYETLPNPVTIAESIQNYSADATTFKYILFEMAFFKNNSTYGSYTAFQGKYFIDPSFVNQRKIVELTAEEKEKLANVTTAYKKYSELAKETSQMTAWEIEPVYTTYPLTAGKLYDKHVQLSTYFLNTIRAGIGLEDYELDIDMVNSAQHKTTLVTYLNNYYDGEDKQPSYSHVFPKPSGIDQEFYDTAMKYAGENLFMGNHITGIMWAIDDFSDRPYCGHRSSLLYPYFTKWGIGWVGNGSLSINSQSCQKFDGYRSSDIEIVAWPANGVTVIDAFPNNTPYWTCNLYNGTYNFSTVDKVVVTNLSTDQVYEITNHTHSSNFIGFKGDAITYEDGDVFEVVFKNVTNTTTGEKQDYSYRSVFHKCYGSTTVDGETLTAPESVTITKYKEMKIPVTLESESNNKLLTFTSSNENIVRVRQNGVIYSNNEGVATITVRSALGSERVIEVNVSEFLKGDMNEDTFINSTDAAIVLDKFKNNDATQNDYNLGDMNEDRVLNSVDASMILDIFKSV